MAQQVGHVGTAPPNGSVALSNSSLPNHPGLDVFSALGWLLHKSTRKKMQNIQKQEGKNPFPKQYILQPLVGDRKLKFQGLRDITEPRSLILPIYSNLLLHHLKSHCTHTEFFPSLLHSLSCFEHNIPVMVNCVFPHNFFTRITISGQENNVNKSAGLQLTLIAFLFHAPPLISP